MEAKLDESPCGSVMLTPVSEVSASDLVALSPPQVSPSSQLSEVGSDAGAAEVQEGGEGGSAESCSEAVSNEEPRADEDKDPKKSKAHLHCPTCKVTVNSTSQLEAHNSGMLPKIRCLIYRRREEVLVYICIYVQRKFSLANPTSSLLPFTPGTKHKLMLEGHSVLPRRRGKVVAARAGCKSKRLASKGSVGVATKSYQCEVCEISVNSETQLTQVGSLLEVKNATRFRQKVVGFHDCCWI